MTRRDALHGPDPLVSSLCQAAPLAASPTGLLTSVEA